MKLRGQSGAGRGSYKKTQVDARHAPRPVKTSDTARSAKVARKPSAPRSSVSPSPALPGARDTRSFCRPSLTFTGIASGYEASPAAGTAGILSVTLYRWAGMNARADSPSITDLVADGWRVEHIDPRYGTALCLKEVKV